MNKIKSVILLAAMAAGILVLTPGCASTSSGGSPSYSTNAVSSTPTMAAMQIAAKSAAYLGAKIAVDKKPNLKPIFEDVQTGLTALIAAGNFSADDLTTLLKKIPVQELQGDNGNLVIGEAVVLWDQFGHQLISLDKADTFKNYVLPVAQAILDGLNMALPKASGS